MLNTEIYAELRKRNEQDGHTYLTLVFVDSNDPFVNFVCGIIPRYVFNDVYLMNEIFETFQIEHHGGESLEVGCCLVWEEGDESVGISEGWYYEPIDGLEERIDLAEFYGTDYLGCRDE